MMAIALIMLAGVFMLTYMATYEPARLAQNERVQSDIVATNLFMYRTAVVKYVAANPGATGAIADGVLTWDLGYAKNPAWRARIDSGQLYVYSTSAAAADPSVVESVYQKSGNSFFVGTRVGGTLYNSHAGNTGIALPATVPVGSVVIVGK